MNCERNNQKPQLKRQVREGTDTFYKNDLHAFGIFRFHGGSTYSNRQSGLLQPQILTPFHLGARRTIMHFHEGFSELERKSLPSIPLDLPWTQRSSFRFRRFSARDASCFRYTFGSTRFIHSLSLSTASWNPGVRRAPSQSGIEHFTFRATVTWIWYTWLKQVYREWKIRGVMEKPEEQKVEEKSKRNLQTSEERQLFKNSSESLNN